MENVERLFKQEIRDKKRIGSNIFSRVSTRKGGTNQALKTPYLYMSSKERKQLSGEVTVYNMNEVMDYQTFKTKSEEDQRMLMSNWRDKYKVQEIIDELGISRTSFYKVIDRLGLPKEITNTRGHKKVVLTENEMNAYSNELIDYSTFRDLYLDQQSQLLEAYIDKYGGVRAVQKEWEGANEAYLYGIRSRSRKISANKQPPENDRVIDSDEVGIVKNESSSAPEDGLPLEESSEDRVKEAVDLLTSIGYFEKEENKQDKEVYNVNDGHGSKIDIDTNSFSFSLKGFYNAETIIKRLELALDVIQDEKELLNLELKITSRQ